MVHLRYISINAINFTFTKKITFFLLGEANKNSTVWWQTLIFSKIEKTMLTQACKIVMQINPQTLDHGDRIEKSLIPKDWFKLYLPPLNFIWKHSQ